MMFDFNFKAISMLFQQDVLIQELVELHTSTNNAMPMTEKKVLFCLLMDNSGVRHEVF